MVTHIYGAIAEPDEYRALCAALHFFISGASVEDGRARIKATLGLNDATIDRYKDAAVSYALKMKEALGDEHG